MPPVLFWEGILGIRVPCLCGCTERVRDSDVVAPDFDACAEMRASEEGMPERHFVVPAAPMQAWKDFVVEEMRQSHDFSQWLMTRDKKMPMPANKEGVLINGVFRPAPLRKAFRAQTQSTVPKEKNAVVDDYNPYMSGMEILAQIFQADYG